MGRYTRGLRPEEYRAHGLTPSGAPMPAPRLQTARNLAIAAAVGALLALLLAAGLHLAALAAGACETARTLGHEAVCHMQLP